MESSHWENRNHLFYREVSLLTAPQSTSRCRSRYEADLNIYVVKEARSFNFTFRYEDDVLSLINYVDRIYPIEPDITGTTYIFRSATYRHRYIDTK
jgi:hypothetical protein